ncbi:MAG: hypothetical protein ACFFAH_17005 [Promethearchaeota archaeon]
MVIHEAGIMVRGYPLVYSTYHQTGIKEIDVVLRSGLLSGILNFIDTAYINEEIEYIESKKYTIAFKVDEIVGLRSIGPEPIVAYAILDKEKKLDKFISKNVIPFLKKVAKKFAKDYTGKNLSEVSQFVAFKKYLDNIFEVESKSIEEKFKDIIL